MVDEKKAGVETPVVAGPIAAPATPAKADATPAIAPAAIVLPQVPPPVPAATVVAAPAGEKK